MENTASDIYTVPIKSAHNPIATAAPRINSRDLCDAVGLDPRRLGDPDARLSVAQLIALYEAAARMTKDNDFGLHVAVRTSLRAFGVLGYILLNSPTVELALERLIRYLPIWTDGGRFTLHREGSTVHLIWQYAGAFATECRHDCEMTLLSVLKVSPLWARSQPREVRFQHPSPKNIGEHKRLFRAPVCFRAPQNEIIFDKAALCAPVRNADPALCDILINVAEGTLAFASSKSSPVDRVRFAVCQSLGICEVGLQSISRAIGLSTRGLQRKLKEHGTSFRRVLAEVRQHRAEQTLRDPQITIAEIAYELGYSHPSEFDRAFRSWTGGSPKQYRRRNAFLSSGNSA